MEVRCPFCREPIAARKDGVRCTRCATPHHDACWRENQGRCTVAGCAGQSTLPFTRRAASRIVVAAGRTALRDTRERLGGKTAVLLLLVSTAAVVGMSELAAVSVLEPAREVRLGVGLGGLFLVLLVWITTLVQRGTRLEDDLQVSVAAEGVDSYYRRLLRGVGLGDAAGEALQLGCEPGCLALDAEGLVLLPVILVVLVVGGLLVMALGPLLAWVALELVYPLLVLAVYGLLYAALALAVHTHPDQRGRPGLALLRGLLYATLYTGLVGLLLEGFHRLGGR